MRYLKRTSVIIFCLILLSNSMPNAFADLNNTENEISHSDYSQALLDMIEYYEPVYGGFTTDETGMEEPIRTNRLIVKTNSNEPVSDDLGAVAKIEGYGKIHILQYSNSELAETAYAHFEAQDSVEYVEYDMYFCVSDDETSATEDVPDSGNHLSWGNAAIKSDIVNQMLLSSNIKLNEVIVAVFDSGLDSDHSLIDYTRILEGKNVWDAENPDDIEDIYGHGTSMSGIILDNTLSNVKIKPYKISNWYGGVYLSQAVDEISNAVEDGVDIINMSFREYGTYYKYFQEEVTKAVDAGVTFVVAAGNENKDSAGCYPALFSNVITVAAVDSNFIPWKNSNWGECVDISAPGVDIKMLKVGGETRTESGTSPAAPFVTAAVAILKSIDSTLTPEEIKARITSSAFVPEGWDSNKYGTGILNCEKMISDMLTARPKIIIDSNMATITSTPSAQIYYTTDDTDPIVGVSPLYVEPINISNISKIKAIAYEEDKLPSIVVLYEKNRTQSLEIRYMGTEILNLKPGEEFGTVRISDEDILTYIGEGIIKAHGVGKTQVTIFTGNNRRVTFYVTVYFEPWQFFHKLFYEWFGILLWSL